MKLFKKLALSLVALTTAAMPLVANAADSVAIESQVNVANVTQNTQYAKSTSAKVDEVVKVQVWYHNRENADSGKVANNLNVKIGLPTAQGTTQTVTSTVSATNSNTVNDSATVNLSIPNASLAYIPGSAQWRHNIGTNAAPNYVTTTISDDVVKTGVNLGDEQPCFNFEATVTVLARVVASEVSITKQVRVLGQKDWVVNNTAKPGDTLEYLITFKNQGNTTLSNVAVGDNMPAHVTYVAGTTMLRNGANPNGVKINSDNVTKGGIDVGNYTPGAVGYVWFQAKIDSNLAPGTYTLKNVGVVRPQGMNEFFNTAITTVTVATPQTTPPTPTPTPTPTPAPTPLPQTGVADAFGGALGTSALGYSLQHYLRSKRSLLSALKRK